MSRIVSVATLPHDVCTGAGVGLIGWQVIALYVAVRWYVWLGLVVQASLNVTELPVSVAIPVVIVPVAVCCAGTVPRFIDLPVFWSTAVTSIELVDSVLVNETPICA